MPHPSPIQIDHAAPQLAEGDVSRMVIRIPDFGDETAQVAGNVTQNNENSQRIRRGYKLSDKVDARLKTMGIVVNGKGKMEKGK